MRVRMKMSYMALCNGRTVKELLLESILDVYNKRVASGHIKAPIK